MVLLRELQSYNSYTICQLIMSEGIVTHRRAAVQTMLHTRGQNNVY